MFSIAIAAVALNHQSASVDALLTDVQQRAVRFFWEQTNPANGFTKDRATNAEQQETHDVASCAAVGFALVAKFVGVEHKWIPRADALARTKVALNGLNTKWPQEHGWLYHFIDYNYGARVWNCEASSIDTSICLAGVIAAEQYWKDPQVTAEAERFIKRIDWKWMQTDGGEKPDALHFSMGWHPGNEGFIKSRWDHFDECKMLYVQGYGLSKLPKESWPKLKRQWGIYDGIPFISGGPLFMHQMSESFYDFRGQRDAVGVDYSIESRNAALANRQYCIDNPGKQKAYGPTFWGLSACDGPDGYNAFGAPGWTNDNGTVTPTSAIATLPFTPNEAKAFAVAMRRDFPNAWGKYGFPNGLCPSQRWTGPDVVGIDLGMVMCAIENARTGLVWKLSRSHPAVEKGFNLMGFRKAAPDPRLKLIPEN